MPAWFFTEFCIFNVGPFTIMSSKVQASWNSWIYKDTSPIVFLWQWSTASCIWFDIRLFSLLHKMLFIEEYNYHVKLECWEKWGSFLFAFILKITVASLVLMACAFIVIISEFSKLNCILSFILHETLKVTIQKRPMN